MVIYNDIDWENIRDINDVMKLSKSLVFEEVETRQDIDMVKLNPNLTEEEIEDAFFWKNYIRGLMLVTGEAGAGKGIFMHMVAYKMRYYFNKLIITDTKPRESFGMNIPFSIPMFVEQVARMEEIEKGIPRPIIIKGLVKGDFKDDEEGWKEYKESNPQDKFREICNRGLVTTDVTYKDFDSRRNEFITIPNFKPHIDNHTGDWISSRGKVFLRNSCILTDEFGSKYMPRQLPGLSISQALLNVFNFLRHLHCIILGVGISIDDFNYRSLDKATWEAKCIRLNNRDYQYSDNPDDIIVAVHIDPIKYNPLIKSSNVSGRGERIVINGSEPKNYLGGLALKDIFVSDNAQGFHISDKLKRRM